MGRGRLNPTSASGSTKKRVTDASSSAILLERSADTSEWLRVIAHMGDRCPKIDMHIMAPRATVRVPSTYRDMSYVIEQCRLLAAQLKAMELQS